MMRRMQGSVTTEVTKISPLIVAAFGGTIGFLLGLVASVINERIKMRRERRALTALFVDHIHDVWSEVDTLKVTPVKPYFSRITTTTLGVGALNLTGEPEYQFEIDDVRFFEIHGLRLATLLKGNRRKQLWRCYRLLRKAEAVRTLIQSLPDEHKDRTEYQKVFQKLVTDYGTQMLTFHRLLT
jgi:hypothetical protein